MKARTPAQVPDAESSATAVSSSSIPPCGADGRREGSLPEGMVVASHHSLFTPREVTTCDACGAPLPGADESGGYGIPGRGTYLWARGDDVHLETAPLCAACASAVGMTALARWEIEEEEG